MTMNMVLLLNALHLLLLHLLDTANKVQLDLGYLATSYPDISIIQPHLSNLLQLQ